MFGAPKTSNPTVLASKRTNQKTNKRRQSITKSFASGTLVESAEEVVFDEQAGPDIIQEAEITKSKSTAVLQVTKSSKRIPNDVTHRKVQADATPKKTQRSSFAKNSFATPSN
jgi:hypothetical protein